MSSTAITIRKLREIRPYARNARTHSTAQVRQIAESIERFGFNNPVLVSASGEIIAGHGRVEAARLLGLEDVPTLCISHLSEDEQRAYVLADNKLALNADWEEAALADELRLLTEADFDVSLTGFSPTELDLLLNNEVCDPDVSPEDAVLPLPRDPITRLGDVWEFGEHRLVCGDARDEAAYNLLLEKEQVGLIFTDPPYNISPAVRGKAVVKHRPFVMARGELSEAEFTTFLSTSLSLAAARVRPGAIAYVCMDWRHIGELISAGRDAFHELKQLCVWDKRNAGMGKFYRSQHELVFVFKARPGKHVNNFGMGGGGRYRTNVWAYSGVSGFREGRGEDLAMHPTVKPVQLVEDAIKDCSRRGDIILDIFAGSGTTLIASERCKRRARLIEIDPAYCDVIIKRFLAVTDGEVRLLATKQTFQEVALNRHRLDEVV